MIKKQTRKSKQEKTPSMAPSRQGLQRGKTTLKGSLTVICRCHVRKYDQKIIEDE